MVMALSRPFSQRCALYTKRTFSIQNFACICLKTDGSLHTTDYGNSAVINSKV